MNRKKNKTGTVRPRETPSKISTANQESPRDRGEKVVYTIGHSTMKIEDFIRILHSYKITLLVDVRTIPKSRHNPQFNKDILPSKLDHESTRYIHIPELGGLRRPSKDSKNTGWTNLSFRGYADYMQTGEFESAVEKLQQLADDETVAVMCAEGNPFRCHRLLLADALSTRQVRAVHISTANSSTQHRMTQCAVLRENRITYPGKQDKEQNSS